jgi:hypothetical protein
MRPSLLLFLAAALQAQSSPRAIALVEEARSQPVEIFADITFQLVPHLSSAAKIDILTEIFERAGEARNSLPSSYPDVQALDTLSLRSRAVRTVLPLDGKRGRQLFELMSHPNVPRPTCEEVVAPNAGIYMDTVEAVFRQGQFSDSEREKRVPWTLVIDAVRGAGSAAEITAAAQRLAPFARSEREQAEMTSALAFGLAVQDSDRAFTGMPPARLVGSLVGAGSFLRRVNQLPLLSALRNYLVRQLTSERCEVTSPTNLESAEAFKEAISGRSDITPLTADEMKAAKHEGRPKTPDVDPALLALERRLNALSSRKPGEDLAELHTSAAWRDQVLQVLSGIETWKGAPGRDSVKIACDKLKLFKTIVAVAPSGVLHQTAMSGMLNILGDPVFLLQFPETWVSEVRDLLMLAKELMASRAASTRIADSPNETGLEMANQIAASKLPALSIYGRLLLLGQAPTAR